MKVTKQALARLNASPVKVKLYNGCFNVATAKATFSRYTLELRVEVTHPALQWQCGNRNMVELTYWNGCEGSLLPVPAELLPLVQRLQEAAAMTNKEAQALSAESLEMAA